MDEKQKEAVIKAVSAVAWADEDLSDEETQKLSHVCQSIGLDESKIQDIIKNNRQIEPVLGELENFSREVIGGVLQFCFRMAVTDNKIHQSELEVIRKIIKKFWQDEDVEIVVRWLKKTYDAEQLYLELFLLPEVRDQKN
ncbi:MAG: TerB family tellurite resistance protein [Spirochaetia bacterium]|nr:TerB family tellurite resistance protein [Spirochaetia bacterium]